MTTTWNNNTFQRQLRH